VCNQVYLLYQDQEICLDFKDGARCLDCVKPPPKRAEIRKRQVSFHFHQFPEGHLLWGPLQFFRNSAKIALLSAKTLRSVWRSFRERRAALNSPLPLHPAPSAAQLETQTAQQLQAAGLPYKQRRERMVAAINQSHKILAVSSWVAQVYQGMGVDAAKLQVMHIGSRIAEAARQQVRPPQAPRQPGAPIRLVFLGLASPPKGLPFLLQAMLDMDNAVLRQIRFSIYARGIYQLNHLLEPLSKRLDLLTVQDGYRYQDLPKLLADKDIGIVPPIWWDNAPQVVFEMLAFHIPVIGAKIGGIPDFVRHDENGLLFEPGNAADAAAQLSRAVLEVDLIARLRKGITPMKTIAEHATELESLYQGL
jgi:glycosyltransferase involved in cell wall biosynthesis